MDFFIKIVPYDKQFFSIYTLVLVGYDFDIHKSFVMCCIVIVYHWVKPSYTKFKKSTCTICIVNFLEILHKRIMDSFVYIRKEPASQHIIVLTVSRNLEINITKTLRFLEKNTVLAKLKK